MSKLYDVVVADPAWQYRNGGNGAAKNHYKTMTTEQICALQVDNITSSAAVMFLWGTWPLLPDCLQVGKAWGFKYVTGLPWIKLAEMPNKTLWGEIEYKPSYGTGFWVRGCSEVITIWRKPEAKTIQTNMVGLLSERAVHSRKPESIYDLADLYPGNKIEFFARQRREGWDAFGNEIEGSIQLTGMCE